METRLHEWNYRAFTLMEGRRLDYTSFAETSFSP